MAPSDRTPQIHRGGERVVDRAELLEVAMEQVKPGIGFIGVHRELVLDAEHARR